MLIGFGLIGLVFRLGIWPHEAALPEVTLGLWALGLIAGLLGLSGTALALPVYWAWMAVAFVMGNIISRVLVVLVLF